MNVEAKQILKKDSQILKKKEKKAQKIRKKINGKILERHENVRGKR